MALWAGDQMFYTWAFWGHLSKTYLSMIIYLAIRLLCLIKCLVLVPNKVVVMRKSVLFDDIRVKYFGSVDFIMLPTIQ